MSFIVKNQGLTLFKNPLLSPERKGKVEVTLNYRVGQILVENAPQDLHERMRSLGFFYDANRRLWVFVSPLRNVLESTLRELSSALNAKGVELAVKKVT